MTSFFNFCLRQQKGILVCKIPMGQVTKIMTLSTIFLRQGVSKKEAVWGIGRSKLRKGLIHRKMFWLVKQCHITAN